MKDFQSSYECAKTILSKYPDADKAWCLLGDICVGLNKNEEACDAFCRANKIKPDPEYQTAYADTLLILKRYKDAEKQIKATTQMYPDYSFAWNTMGNVYLRLGDLKKALSLYNHAKKLAPDNPIIQKNITYVEEQIRKNSS